MRYPDSLPEVAPSAVLLRPLAAISSLTGVPLIMH